MSERQIPLDYLGVLVEDESDQPVPLAALVREVDDLVADIMSDIDESDGASNGLGGSGSAESSEADPYSNARARREGLIQPYANPGTPKRVRAVVAFYDGEFKNFNQMLGIVGDSYLSRHEAGEFYRADGTYLGYLEPDPEQLAEWNKEVEYARAGEAEVRKHQEKYVNRLPAWDLEKWRKKNKITFQGIPKDYDPSFATYNSTFIADLMRDTDGDDSGEM